jgi:hypothetical protein
MMSTTILVADVLAVFEQHGLHHHDDEHTGHAIALVRAAAFVYDLQQHALGAAPAADNRLSRRQLRLLADMCEDARACVTAGIETCPNCDGGICRPHTRALARAESYRTIARQLGACDVTSPVGEMPGSLVTERGVC